MAGVSKNQRTNRGQNKPEEFKIREGGVVVLLANGRPKYLPSGPFGQFAGVSEDSARLGLLPGETVIAVEDANERFARVPAEAGV